MIQVESKYLSHGYQQFSPPKVGSLSDGEVNFSWYSDYVVHAGFHKKSKVRLHLVLPSHQCHELLVETLEAVDRGGGSP